MTRTVLSQMRFISVYTSTFQCTPYRYWLVVELFYVPYMVLQISTFFLLNLTKCSSFLISLCHLLYNKLFVSVRRQMFSFSPTQLIILNWIKFKKKKQISTTIRTIDMYHFFEEWHTSQPPRTIFHQG